MNSVYLTTEETVSTNFTNYFYHQVSIVSEISQAIKKNYLRLEENICDDWTQLKRTTRKKKLTPHYRSNCPNSITFTHLGISCLCYCKGNVHSIDKLSPIESFIIFFFYKKSLFIYCGQMKKENVN